jgi:hypothetical protein
LDGGFPYLNKGPYPSLAAVNDARIGDGPSVGVFSSGGQSSLEIVATTYFMCQATNSAGVGVGGWVPLAELNWSYYVDASWPKGAPMTLKSGMVVNGQVPVVKTPIPFEPMAQAVLGFPDWSGKLLPAGKGCMRNTTNGCIF